MAQNLVNFVVGIKDQAGNICGTGFVIADRVIATCAHVIDAVKAQPGQTVTVIFSPINKDYLTMVWPAGYQSHNDVAILIGHEPLPSGIQAAILCSPALSRPNVEFSTSGYRRLGSQREGIPAGGKLIGQMLAIRRQPLPSHPPLILESKQIADGMSGAPLYIPEIDRVVGIVTSYWDAERGQTGSRDLETAFAMPAEAIAESWPQLPFKPPTTGIDQDDRTLYNRHVMLQRVKEFWVEGFLEQSLHTTVLIELTLKEQSAALYQPWDTVLQRPYHPDRLLPAGTKLVDLFDKVGQALLILGEPGAGKTTTLLELARELITRAEKELAQPIPAIFPLASWSGEQGGLAAWLVEELNTQYRIPRQISQGWVEKNELVLLLDGLDEVAEAHRSNCVQAINDFCREHLAPVVVCSRREEFERLQTKFSFSQAILLQPLTPAQIENYLTQLGPEVTTIQSALQTDPSLYELVQSPLTLNIMILAYRDLPATELSRLDSTQARYRHLFKNYVQQMFERGGPNQGYTQEQTLHWLTWLAQQMCRYTPGVFFI
ncbi:MAG: NACHT domain-containing protein [Rubrivivax sp.]|nr:NACHT domain-containing protein [Rubrivivax sp.]